MAADESTRPADNPHRSSGDGSPAGKAANGAGAPGAPEAEKRSVNGATPPGDSAATAAGAQGRHGNATAGASEAVAARERRDTDNSSVTGSSGPDAGGAAGAGTSPPGDNGAAGAAEPGQPKSGAAAKPLYVGSSAPWWFSPAEFWLLKTKWLPPISKARHAEFANLTRTIRECAAKDGRNQQPPAHSLELSPAETEAIRCTKLAIDKLVENYADVLVSASAHMEENVRELDGGGNEITKFVNDLLAKKNNETLVILQKDRLKAEQAEETFQDRHNLADKTSGKTDPMLFWSEIALILVCDTLFTASILQAVNRHGLVGGYLQAIGISAVNVWLGIIGGLIGWRLARHEFPLPKFCGYIVSGFFLAAAIAWNMLVGVYRDVALLASEGKVTNLKVTDDLLKVAYDTFRGDPLFWLNSVPSLLLVCLGLFAFLLVSGLASVQLAGRYWGWNAHRVNVSKACAAVDRECRRIKRVGKSRLRTAAKSFKDGKLRSDRACKRGIKIADQVVPPMEKRAGDAKRAWADKCVELVLLYRRNNVRARRPASPPTSWAQQFKWQDNSETWPQSVQTLTSKIGGKRTELESILGKNAQEYTTFAQVIEGVRDKVIRTNTLREDTADEAASRLGLPRPLSKNPPSPPSSTPPDGPPSEPPPPSG